MSQAEAPLLSSFWSGAGLLLLSGIMNGSFALPLRFARRWRWENTWLVFSTVALLVLPAGFALSFVPNLWDVYRSLGFFELLPALGFGLLWGAGQASFGVAISKVGMAMAFAVVVGTGTVLGSIVPLAVLHPERIVSPRGLILLFSAALLAAGLAVYGRAARERERATDPGRSVSYAALAICVTSGVLGAAINLGFAFSRGIERQAIRLGADARAATLAIWLPLLAAGYLANLAYSLYLLRRNRSLALFREQPLRGSMLASLMGILWLVSTLGYGWGSVAIGVYGTSVGYAIYDSSLILWSTMLGIMAGEWRGVAREVGRTVRAGVALILAAVVVLSSSV